MSDPIYPTRLEGSNIRLLELMPGRPEEDVVCRLIERPLADAPPFDALSYVWGDINRQQSIVYNGNKMKVTDSLFNALRTLRLALPSVSSRDCNESDPEVVVRPRRSSLSGYERNMFSNEVDYSSTVPKDPKTEMVTSPRKNSPIDELDSVSSLDSGPKLIWVDAICINQQDVIERNFQVQLMRDIYSKAARVVVWLGTDPENHAKKAIAAINVVCQKLDELQALVARVGDKGVASERLDSRVRFSFGLYAQALKCAGIANPWADLWAFFMLPWWTRIWCVQEIFLARESVLIFGNDSIDGKNLVRFTEWYARESYFGIPYHPALIGLSSLENTWINQAYFNFNFAKLNRRDLCLICLGFKSLHATNPRDKVYGLLGLWDSTSHSALKVDYNKTTAQVYTDVVLQAINERKSLFVLRMVNHEADYEPNDTDEFPSWVPRWDKNEEHWFMWLDKSPIAASHFAAEPPDVDLAYSGVLKVKGYLFDEIVWTSDVLQGSSKSFYTDEEFNRAFVKLYREAIGMEPNPIFAHQVTVAELATALTWGIIKAGQEFLDNDQTDPNAWLDIADLDTDTGRRYVSNFHAFMNKQPSLLNDPGPFESMIQLSQRRVFRTQRGYFGVAQRSARVGDTVTVLHGGKVPHVLRHRKDYFNYIGDCFLQDIANGQVHDMEEKGVVVKSVFEIH